MVDERPRERDPLLLAAREHVRLAPLEAGELHHLAGLRDPSFQLLTLYAASPEAEGHVVEDVEVGEDGVGLEDGVYGPPVRRHPAHRVPVDGDTAPGRFFETGNHPQRRGLAAPARSQQREELALVDVEREVTDRDELPKALGNRGQLHGDGTLHIPAGAFHLSRRTLAYTSLFHPQPPVASIMVFPLLRVYPKFQCLPSRSARVLPVGGSLVRSALSSTFIRPRCTYLAPNQRRGSGSQGRCL